MASQEDLSTNCGRRDCRRPFFEVWYGVLDVSDIETNTAGYNRYRRVLQMCV